MTDNEIIKAMECCIGGWDYCKECPAKEYNVECGNVLRFNVLNLINRQKAEIRTARTEAIKEFAEMLKTKNEDFCVDKGDMAFCVDNLVKEFMEGENG